MSSILAIDVGTGGCKAVIFDPKGKDLGSSYEEYPIIQPKPDWAEQDPRQWWEAIKRTVRKVVTKTEMREEIVAVSVTSQREGLIPVDSQGNPLANCILWMDKRTIPQCDAILKKISREELFKITGLRLDPAFSLAKLLWIRENQADIYKRTYKFLQAEDYILSKLSGEFVTEQSVASRTMLLDVSDRDWSSAISDKFSIEQEKLPQLLEPGTPLGKIRKETASELGLNSEMMVIAGGGDQQCAALGVGAITPDIVSIGLGTASALSITLDKPILDGKMEIPCCCAAAAGKWEFEPPIWTTGALLRWFRDNLGTDEIESAQKRGIDPYEVMTKEAESISPGAEGLITLPYFMGAGAPNWNSQARGAIIGLTLGHNRAHIIRSLMEAVAYEISLNIETIEELGNEIKEIALSGGGSRSTLWQKIICDVTGKEISLPSTEDAPSLGVAMLASVGVGLYPDLKTAGENMTSVKGRVYADEDRRKIYNRLLKVYRTAYSGLLDTFSKFNQL